MTDPAPPPSVLARFRGPVTCRRTLDAMTLSGPAADSADDILILTFIGPALADLPGSLTDAAILPLGQGHYRIASAARDWLIEATSVHLHRDIGTAFYRAVPPRTAPVAKRLFWRVVLTLAATRAGKRLLLALRS